MNIEPLFKEKPVFEPFRRATMRYTDDGPVADFEEAVFVEVQE